MASSDGQRLTYREVDQRANQMAHWLLANGIMPNDPVAVCMDKRPELYIALLGILKSGASQVLTCLPVTVGLHCTACIRRCTSKDAEPLQALLDTRWCIRATGPQPAI